MTNYDGKDRYFAELSEFIDRQVLDYVCLESGDDSHIVGGLGFNKHAKNFLGLLLFRKLSTCRYYVCNPASQKKKKMCAILRVGTMCAILPPKRMVFPYSCDHDNHSCFYVALTFDPCKQGRS